MLCNKDFGKSCLRHENFFAVDDVDTGGKAAAPVVVCGTAFEHHTTQVEDRKGRTTGLGCLYTDGNNRHFGQFLRHPFGVFFLLV